MKLTTRLLNLAQLLLDYGTNALLYPFGLCIRHSVHFDKRAFRYTEYKEDPMATMGTPNGEGLYISKRDAERHLENVKMYAQGYGLHIKTRLLSRHSKQPFK